MFAKHLEALNFGEEYSADLSVAVSAHAIGSRLGRHLSSDDDQVKAHPLLELTVARAADELHSSVSR